MNSINAAIPSRPGSLAQATGANKSDLGQEEYLKLMITQFQNQDPFKPMENGEFLGQIAQFGTVSGIAELKDSFSAVAASISSDQTLQASGLIGRTVLMNTNQGYLPAGGELAGAVEMPIASNSVTVEVRDEAGQVVRTLNMGQTPEGLAHFSWDGLNQTGEQQPAGNYFFSARIDTGIGNEAVPALVAGRVDSVSLSPYTGQLSLNFEGMAALDLSQIRQIM